MAKLKNVPKKYVGHSKLIKQNTLKQTENKSHVDKSNDLSDYCSCESNTGHHYKACLLYPLNKEKLSRFVTSGHDTFEQNGIVKIGYNSNSIQPRGPAKNGRHQCAIISMSLIILVALVLKPI